MHMEPEKTFSSRSNAKRNAIKAGVPAREIKIVPIGKGDAVRFAWRRVNGDEAAAREYLAEEEAQEQATTAGTSVLTEEFVDAFNKNAPAMRAELEKVEAKVFADADGHGAGARLLNTPEARKAYEEEVVKPAQAAREERNGVRRPGPGKCLDVWLELDRILALGEIPTLADARAYAERTKTNRSNAEIEYYQHRKFHGYGKKS